MPRYNVYKLIKTKEIELTEKLANVGLTESGNREVDGSRLTFYMSTEPRDIPIWWAKLYIDFLDNLDEPFNKCYFGVLLITSDQYLYGISLGKSHFYLKDFCDTDFGINLAERIVDPTNLRIKNSKLFGGKRNKSIITYQTGSELEYDSGESMQFLKAKSTDKDLWGETVSFGHSVQFNLKDFLPHRLPQLIARIENKLGQDPIVRFPRAEIIKDEVKRNELDQRLARALMNYFANLGNNDAGNNANLDLNEAGLSGVDFIFLNKTEFAYMWNRKILTVQGDITLESFREFVEENSIDLSTEFNRVRVRASDEHNQGFTKEIKYFLDYVDHNNYCLLDGKWHKFNQQYIDFVKREVDKITMGESDTNFSQSGFEAYRNQLPPEERRRIYGEKYFNQQMSEQEYLNLDRDNIRVEGFTLERADLYKDGTLFFVKIGTPQKLAYVIDQAMTTLNVLQNQVTTFVVDGQTLTPNSLCLWILLDRRSRITRLSQIESLNFLIKLVEWSKQVKNAGFTPIVRVGYKVT